MTTATISANEAVDKVTQASLNPLTEKRVVKSIKPGQVVRQGDIYLVRLNDEDFGKARESLTPWNAGQQLAEGTSVGSRHVALKPAKAYSGYSGPIPGTSGNLLRGPVVDAPARFTITHPEHAHVELPKGKYGVLYQVDTSTRQRVAD